MNPVGPATWLGVIAIAIGAGPRAGQLRDSARQRYEELQQRLSAERMLLDALREQRLGALEALDFLQQRASYSTARAERLNQALLALQSRIQIAQADEKKSRLALDAQVSRLGPRLLLLYRLLRHRPVELMVSTQSSDSVLWRSRHVAAVVRQDLALMAEVHRATEFQRVKTSQLQSLGEVLESARETTSREAEEAALRRQSWSQWLASLQGGEQKSARLIGELQEAEKKLARLLERLSGPGGPSGFEAMKGRLPYPTDGIIEVRFGRVVNPRFNTVTVQKGVDIRAARGAAVRAIAGGRVVYASWLRGYGNLVIVDHGHRYHSLMAHLDSFTRAVGDVVQVGEELGRVGDTGSVKGPYLYFEIRRSGEAMDPAAWLREVQP